MSRAEQVCPNRGGARRVRWLGVCLLVALTAYAAVLRLWVLSDASLWIDEAFSVLHAKAITQHGYPAMPTGTTAWDAFPAHYLMALPLLFVPQTEATVRFTPALFGTLLIPLFFFLNLALTRSWRQALLAAALLAFSTYEIAWSRQARGYVILQFFCVGALLAAARFLDRPSVGSLWCWAACAWGSVFCHRAGWLAPVVTGLWVLCDAKGPRALARWGASHWRAVLALAVAVAVLLVWWLRLGSGARLLSAVEFTSHDGPVGGGATAVPRCNYAKPYGLLFVGQYGPWLAWALAGAVAFTVSAWRVALPLIAGAALYMAVIAFRNPLFHLRYALPVWYFVPLFAAYGIDAVLRLTGRVPAALFRRVALLVVVLALAVSALAARMTFHPRSDYDLGPTDPQSDWRAAYAWVAATPRHAPTVPPPIASTFPELAEVYLGEAGERRFLPLSLSGLLGDIRKTSPYSVAPVVRDLGELCAFRGYVVLDTMGLTMLENGSIQGLLSSIPPVHIVPGPRRNHVFVWRLRSLDRPPPLSPAVRRLACLGDSITAGGAPTLEGGYPGILARLLGERWVVRNFGVPGATVLTAGKRPYLYQPALFDLLDFEPDVIVVMLGTNDSHPAYERFANRFAVDYEALLGVLSRGSPTPRVVLCEPPPIRVREESGRDKALENRIGPAIRQLGRKYGLETVELRGALGGSAVFADALHPNAEGHERIARILRAHISSEETTPAAAVGRPLRPDAHGSADTR